MDRAVVVGGGVLGIMHALQARRRGMDVVHLEREPAPRGASVRNFDLPGRAEQLLGTGLPPTRCRWAGIYSQVTTGELYHRSQVAPGVVPVTGPGGRGMTCAPAIAEETFA